VKSKAALFIRWSLLSGIAVSVAGCGASLSDYSLKDQEWFAGAGRVFKRNISIEAPPLTPTKPVTPQDMLSPEGGCAEMQPAGAPGDAGTGPVALGHTECDVVREVGQPSNVQISADAQGRRFVTVTYASGPRAGIYQFTSGRLSSIEALPAPASPPSRRGGRGR